MYKRGLCLLLSSILFIPSTAYAKFDEGVYTQNPHLAIEKVKEFAVVKFKKDKTTKVIYSTSSKKMKGKKCNLKFNKKVFVEKNYSSNRVRLYENGKTLKVVWKSNSDKACKFRICTKNNKSMVIKIKVSHGVG